MLAQAQRAVNRPYRKLATSLYTWAFAYLGLLWIAAVWDWQGFAVGLMWFAGIVIFPVAYLQPTNLVVLSIVEWLNRRDDAKRWDTIRVGVLLFICIMGAGGLAILLSIMNAGKAFPVVIPMILMIVACMGYAGKVNTERWMVVLAVLATFIAIFSTLKVIPYGEMSQGLYDSTGYSVGVTPSKAEVAARKAIAENERLADRKIAACIAGAKARNEGKVVPESVIAKENAACHARYAIADAPLTPESTPEAILQAERENSALLKSLEVDCINKIKDAKLKHDPPLPLDAGDRAKMKECSTKYKQLAPNPSHKEGAGGHYGEKTPKWLPSWAREWGPLQWMLGTIGGGILLHVLLWGPFIVLLGWLGFKIGKKNNESVTAAATATKVVEKTKVAGTIFGLTFFEWMVGLAAIWLVLSIVAGKFITNPDEFRGVFEGRTTTEKVTGYPGSFFTADELPQWEAWVDGPQVHRFFGDMSGPLQLVKLVDSGKRADIVSQLESGRGFIVKVDELDPTKDIVFNNSVCPPAKIPLGGNRHQTVCTSSGRSGDGSLRFSIEMGWTATERYAVLIQDDTRQVIRLRFTPRFP